MATQETIVDQRPIDLAPIDPNVTIPKHVQDAARAAEAFYAQPEPTAEEKAAADAAAEAERVAAEQQAQNPPQQDQQQPPQHQDVQQPSREDLQNDQWAGRYNSMKGRWEAVSRQLGIAQQQLIEAGDEIGRLNALLSRAGVQPTAPSQDQGQQQPVHNKLITDADREAYGDEFLDTVARAARGAVQPDLERLQTENQELKKRVITEDQRQLRTDLARAVPNWAATQRSPEWNRWLHLPNVYTNQVRGEMLRAAYAAADAPKVIALFQDFVKEVQATGGTVPTGQRQEQQQAPRTPAIELDTLAAPGRARPAGGDTQSPADKPTYTRQQIAANYADKRRGLYNGRETVWANLDADMIAAGREGRIR